MTSGTKKQIGMLVAALLISAGIIGSGLNFGTTHDDPNSEGSTVLTDANIESSEGENHVQTMLTFIDQQIAVQEDVKDVRCWSSVNKIQTFISGLPVDTEAIGQRVEFYIEMLDDIWHRCVSDNKGQPVTADQVQVYLNDRFPEIARQVNVVLKPEDNDGFDMSLFTSKEQCDAVKDYSDTIESWRLLQSWLLRKVDVPTAQVSAPFDDEALLELKRFLVVYDINLLKRARVVAMENKLARVNVEVMKEAFNLQWKGKATD